MRLLPGDLLWDRFRVDSVTTSRCDSALLTPLQSAGNGAAPRYRMISLAHDSQHPLSELLLAGCRALRNGGSHSVRESARRKKSVPVPAPAAGQPGDERPVLPLLGAVEWIGEPAESAIAIVEVPAAVPLQRLWHHGGADSRQVLWLLRQLADAAEFWTRLLSSERDARELSAELPVLLARQLHSERLVVHSDNSRLAISTACTIAGNCSGAVRPPAFVYSLPPEVYTGNVTPAVLVFAIARTAVLALGGPEQSGVRQTRRLTLSAEQSRKPVEAEWAALAAWTSGKRDAAAEFKASGRGNDLPAELRSLLTRALARTPSRRPTLAQFGSGLDKMAAAGWNAGTDCAGCGFPLKTDWLRECPCCGRVPVETQVRSSRRGTTAISRRLAQNPPEAARTENMILIPAGTFLSGERRVPRTLRDFYIDVTPVTEGDYKKFLTAVKRTARAGGPGSKASSFDRHPVIQISWYEANEFAEFHNKRLPTVYEWEKAARGIDGRKFPYGNTYLSKSGRLRLPSEASAAKPEESGTVAVATHPDGVSPYGVLDMAGNVLEWTSSARRAGERLYRALKGASFRDGSSELSRCTSVQYLPPETVEPFIGFRCVKDLE